MYKCIMTWIYNIHLTILTVNKDVTSDDGVRRLLKEVETQFGDCLIPTTSLSKNVIIGKGTLSDDKHTVIEHSSIY